MRQYAKFPQQRLAMARAAVDALEDKAARVRKAAVALLVELILAHSSTHPKDSPLRLLRPPRTRLRRMHHLPRVSPLCSRSTTLVRRHAARTARPHPSCRCSAVRSGSGNHPGESVKGKAGGGLASHDPVWVHRDRHVHGFPQPWVRPAFAMKADDGSLVMLAELEASLRIELYKDPLPGCKTQVVTS
ncbi:hypothetical protein C8Q78DRAFT_1083648 [Trametes maxima]|nr:hypothetical protein C8Q78DRAFT_1083648 [Trametes maxima]